MNVTLQIKTMWIILIYTKSEKVEIIANVVVKNNSKMKQ